jgi:hypothetical protein
VVAVAVVKIDYNEGLPSNMAALKRDEAGRPVPYFVEWIDGKPDFRIMSSSHLRAAIRGKLCWVCGKPLFAYATFTAGPMCLVNRNSAEPPSHYECAVYSATHCPFLVNPNKERREANMPAEPKEPAGIMITRNPGVTCLVGVKSWVPYAQGSGVLFEMGSKRLNGPYHIERVDWFAESRRATREEVQASIDSGIPLLAEQCNGDARCLAYLDKCIRSVERWLPA